MRSKEEVAVQVSVISIIVNITLSGFKLLAGLLANSTAMLSDAVHSMSDVLSTIVVIIGVKLASKKPDAEHQYGHERLECVAAIILAVLLAITGLAIAKVGLEKILNSTNEEIAIPGILALVAAFISILVKEAMYWYAYLAGKKIQSSVLIADAWHHRSDALSSVGSLVGIFGARLGFPILDPLTSLLICVMILKVSYDIFKDTIDKLVDKACEPALIEEFKNIALAQDQVLDVDEIKSRIFADKIYLDLEISLDANLSLEQAHDVAQKVHDVLEENYSQIKHCMVHVNPYHNKKTRTKLVS